VTAPATGPDAITLQINLSAGDLAYLETTVPALVAGHRPDVQEVIVVADACRPQSTPLLHATSRFPADAFRARVARLEELCARLLAARVVDRVVWLQPGSPDLRALNAKYAGIATPRTHDHLGHAFSAYFLGWESARTRYVAHFDADIVLWQQAGFRWLPAARAALERDPALLGASPRIAPPPATGDAMVNITAPGSGWLPSWPLERGPGGWRSPWFSTRCHLMDRTRLAAVLPLRPARAGAYRRAAWLDRRLAPWFERGLFSNATTRLGRSLRVRLPPFPLPPEVLLHEHAQQDGFACLYLDDPRAWFIHPDTKPEIFLRVLPKLLAAAGQRGECPPAQRGVSGVQFTAWESFAT
jgi:hypothetical protein